MSALCHEEVTRQGQLEPCGKVAVGMIRWHDDDLSGAYPACAWHLNAAGEDNATPLDELLAETIAAGVTGYIKVCGGSQP